MHVEVIEVHDKSMTEGGAVSLMDMAGIDLRFGLEEDFEPWDSIRILQVLVGSAQVKPMRRHTKDAI